MKKIIDKGYDYIVAARIKNMKQEIKDQIFTAGYTDIPKEEEVLRYKGIDYINQVNEGQETYSLPEKLVITYSSKRAQEDKADQERLVAKAESMLKSKASYKRGGRKYLKEVSVQIGF